MDPSPKVYTGIFEDEMGQRFLRVARMSSLHALEELHDKCVPSRMSQFKQCLTCIARWDRQILQGEINKLTQECPDFLQCFKYVYVKYVKSMRGNKSGNLKIMIQLPKFEEFHHSFLTHLSNHPHVRAGKLFTGTLLDQDQVYMQCCRDALFNYLGPEYVRVENKHRMHVPAPIEERSDGSASEDDLDSILPDDSVSNLGYSHRKKREKNDNTDVASLSSVSLSEISQNSRKKHSESDPRVSSSRRSQVSEDSQSDVRSERSETRKSDSLHSESDVSTRQETEPLGREFVQKGDLRQYAESDVSDTKSKKRVGLSEESTKEPSDDSTSVSLSTPDDIIPDKFKTSRDKRDQNMRDDTSYASYRSSRSHRSNSSSRSHDSHRSHRSRPSHKTSQKQRARSQEDTSSSEEEDTSSERYKSPCRSYVTDLSRMSEEY